VKKTEDSSSTKTMRSARLTVQIQIWSKSRIGSQRGAGLTQISSFRQWIRDVGAYLAPGFGGTDSARVFAISTVLYYLFAESLVGYLWTRLYLAGAMVQAELNTIKREISEIKEQSVLDGKALSLAIKQLNPSTDGTTPLSCSNNSTMQLRTPRKTSGLRFSTRRKRFGKKPGLNQARRPRWNGQYQYFVHWLIATGMRRITKTMVSWVSP
jgi:hypothetical protein